MVLLEAKVKYYPHVFAQLLGYYVRVCANIWKPGCCVLLTEDLMYITIFSFVSKENDHPLTNACCFKPINYLEAALKVLGIITHGNFTSRFVLEEKYVLVYKDFCFKVETTEMSRLRVLEEEFKAMKRSYVKMQEKLMKMKCRAIPVSYCGCGNAKLNGT